jgi:hypothetical protein
MTVNVFVAKLSNLASNAVFEKVRDWTLSGLVGDSFWIDIDEPTKVIRINAAGNDKVDAQSWVATSPGELQFYSLQVLKSEGSKVSEDAVNKTIKSIPAFEGYLARLVNLIFPLTETKDATDVLFRDYLNLVSLPTDAFAPDSVPLDLSKSSNTYFSNCAKELITVAGLWPGQSEGMLSGVRLNLGSTDNVMIARSFVRYVDASSFVKSVIDKVIDGDGKNLATPVDASGRALNVVSGAEAAAAVSMVAQQFKDTHPQLQFVDVPNRNTRPPIAANFLKLLGYYFLWVGKWIIRQPGNILQKAIADRKVAIAKSVQELFGSKSEFMVLVGGVSAHEYPDGIPLAADSIMETVQAQLRTPVVPAPAQPGTLWKEMVEVATSLADGAPLSISGIDMPAHEGLGRRVITDPNLITPNYFEKAFDIPAGLSVPYKGHRIPASDPLTARLVQESLEESRVSGRIEPTSIAAVSKLQQDLVQWRSSNRSFVWNIGDMLADSIFRGLKTWGDLSAQIQDINTDSLIKAEEKAQASLKRLFKGVFLIIGIAGIAWLVQALVVYWLFGSWPVVATWWSIPASIVAALVIVWNIVGIVTMNGAVKELFRLQHELEKANDRVTYAKEAREKIWVQISRLTTYYQQYQAWVAILSNFVHKHPTTKVSAKSGEELAGSQSLPQSMTIASLVPATNGDGTDLSTKVSNQYYTSGWLTAAIVDVLTSEVTNFNAISNDSMANDSTPLGLARKWAAGTRVQGAIKGAAVDKIQQLATAGTAYQSWKVRLKNAVGDVNESNGQAFIGQLGKGGDYLPLVGMLTASGSVSDSSMIDRSNSACGFDSRLELDGDLGRLLSISRNNAESRSLDFLGLRFETSKKISPMNLKIFNPKESDGQGSTSGFLDPSTPA